MTKRSSYDMTPVLEICLQIIAEIQSDSNEVCGLFGDTWDNCFQYEDSNGCIVGCYIDPHFIDKVNVEFEKHLADECASWEAWIMNQS